jgi:benzodiazapine receptor
MHPTAALVCALAAPFSVGFMGSLATQPALEKGGWYRRIKKPKWTPPDFCFPLVWTLLYAAMGVASWRVWLNGGTATQWTAYAAQLALNGAFSPLLFSLHRPLAAFVDTMLLLVATAACIGASSREANKALSS